MNLRCSCISCKYEKQKSTEDPCYRCYNDSEYVYDGKEHSSFPPSGQERRAQRMKLSERFINAIDEDSIISGTNARAIEDAVNFIRKYEAAEEQGRLVILPCKVGDKVFRVIPKCSGSYIHCPFEGGHGLDRCNNCDAFIKEESFCFFMFEDIGKTVFLTREEAEAAMK